ncbi:hypothetical protein BJG93_24525 [Paraburkholderia sprentiae WSM5005]|uniref:Helix-turn-helix domain-containing protein n=1 Tax=Paraburkholderia sprentiae WSM5005 TaxID=754502 RepID=A0A1I9YQP5_9BURK|nr:hypothetical protein [Paraburkholderia sprentiae]APA88517.1 hypothetical protein BJG93_24525 [Paraburkholderia sprentiae WSM5005]
MEQERNLNVAEITELTRNLTIREFCELMRQSRTSYFNNRRLGLGPDEVRVGRHVIIITPQAVREWLERHTVRAAEAKPTTEEEPA